MPRLGCHVKDNWVSPNKSELEKMHSNKKLPLKQGHQVTQWRFHRSGSFVVPYNLYTTYMKVITKSYDLVEYSERQREETREGTREASCTSGMTRKSPCSHMQWTWSNQAVPDPKLVSRRASRRLPSSELMFHFLENSNFQQIQKPTSQPTPFWTAE